MNQTLPDGLPKTNEHEYETVYGKTFALYSKQEIDEFIQPFYIRFERNGIDPCEVFEGKTCFDAGCGGGRGTLFMLQNGAKHVTAYDYSAENVVSTKKNCAEYGFTNVTVEQGTLEQISHDDQIFDFVWCNGVVMHAAHPNNCLAELSRILKVDGKMWLYMYGAGGVYWRVIFWLRTLMKDIDTEKCIEVLRLYRYSNRYVAEYIDDWFATHLRSYTRDDLDARLKQLGFENTTPLKYGVDYDTSHRRNSLQSPQEQALMGEGDLRYLLYKDHHDPNDRKLIDEGQYGSVYQYPPEVTDIIDPLFEEVISIAGDRAWLKISIAAHIQRELRLLLDTNVSFPMHQFAALVQEVTQMARDSDGI